MLGLAASLALALGLPSRATGEDALGPLPWRIGGTVGFTVDAAAFPDSAGQRVEVYVRVPPATIAGLVYDSTGTGQLKLGVKLRSGHGGRTQERVEQLEIARSDSARGFGKVVLLSFPGRTGPQRLEVRLEDTRSRKRGIAYFGRQVTESGVVKGDFVIETPKRGALEVSTLEFVWDENTGGAGAFTRAGHTRLPNPERLYGLYATELKAAFAARGGDASRPWRWRARILDRAGQAVVERESTGTATPAVDATLALDVSQLPAGGYDLELAVSRDGDAAPAIRRSRFSVAWQPGTWFRNPRDVEDAVHLLLQPADEEAFALMQAGEQEQFLDAFWRARDPSPGAAVNEAYETFRKRIEHANLNYSRSSLGPGLLTDMGRVYVRYGEPTEILRQVVPTGDNNLMQAIRDLELTEDRAVGSVRQRGLGADLRPFEVWIYEGDIPPPFDADPRVERPGWKRIVFLFVDEHGLGEYRLRFSTE